MTRANPIGQREADLQRQVLELAELRGWRRYHTFDSRRSHAGFPDLVLLRGLRLIFAELKAPNGKLRPEQAEWLDELVNLMVVPRHPRGASIETYLWRPADWPEVEQVLR